MGWLRERVSRVVWTIDIMFLLPNLVITFILYQDEITKEMQKKHGKIKENCVQTINPMLSSWTKMIRQSRFLLGSDLIKAAGLHLKLCKYILSLYFDGYIPFGAFVLTAGLRNGIMPSFVWNMMWENYSYPAPNVLILD